MDNHTRKGYLIILLPSLALSILFGGTAMYILWSMDWGMLIGLTLVSMIFGFLSGFLMVLGIDEIFNLIRPKF